MAALAGLVLASCWLSIPAAEARPQRKGFVYDSGVTGAAAILTSSLVPNAPTVAYRITVALDTTDSVFNVTTVLSGATSFTLALNNGTALTAGRLYTFSMGADRTVTHNFTCTTTTRVAYLLVEEIREDEL